MAGPTPEEIATALAAIKPEDIIRSGVVGGREWAKCMLCGGSERHDFGCPWFMAWEWSEDQKRGT